MNDMYSYKGTRWYKCDLHLHTVDSECFQDKSVTADQWVQAAIDKGLNCVAVTDHNNGISVDKIKNAAKDTDLIVFPGVEITCDPSKVHLLIIFDVNKTSADIRDFLVCTDIPPSDFGKQCASTIKSIFDIADLAKNKGAIVIPAHIDSHNGLGTISAGSLKKFYTKHDINAVQVVHKEFLDQPIQIIENDKLKSTLNEYYNHPSPAIDDTTIKEWSAPVRYALENKLAILTFSDNPHEVQSPKHGLWGIGNQYTWIKMDEKPSLEGLRQAFLLPEYRIKNIFDCPSTPYKKPALWIKSLKVSNTTITDKNEPLKIDFSPQLNTIIGGRGSGKSSILRFIRGVFNRTVDLENLTEILNDHNDFYKIESGRPKKGVLTNKSVIEVKFVRNDVLHKIKASDIHNSSKQVIQIYRLNKSDEWDEVQDEGYIEFFEYEQYSQKEIFEIAKDPNALRERIDKSIEGLEKINNECERVKSEFMKKSAIIRTIDKLLTIKGKTETRIKDIEANIKKMKESGITELLTANEKYNKESVIVGEIQTAVEERKIKIGEMAESVELPEIDLSIFDEIHQKEMSEHTKSLIEGFSKIKNEFLKLQESASKLEKDFKGSVNESLWKKDLEKNTAELAKKKDELEVEGIDLISNFEKLTSEKNELTKELEEINSKASTREADINERESLQNEYLILYKEITEKRRDFIQKVITGDNVKVNIKPFRNRNDFEIRLRQCIQKENSTFQDDIDSLINLCFTGNVEQNIVKFRDVFKKIRKNEVVSDIVGGKFVSVVNKLNDTQIDEIELMLPEDEIEVQYKATAKSSFKSLSTASAGQKTTAILTFILSYGNAPLILDQPEDDLDNRLVYDLVVDRLKQAKENRQLIVVTHNANIPVNGDAEYIISMDSESRFLKVIQEGSVEQAPIKREICDVMEGGEIAFEMRTKRYQFIG